MRAVLNPIHLDLGTRGRHQPRIADVKRRRWHNISVRKLVLTGHARNQLGFLFGEEIGSIFQLGLDNTGPVSRHRAILHRPIVLGNDFELALGQKGGIHDA